MKMIHSVILILKEKIFIKKRENMILVQKNKNSWFHLKGSWSVHSFNGDYLYILVHTGSWGNLFHEIPGTIK